MSARKVYGKPLGATEPCMLFDSDVVCLQVWSWGCVYMLVLLHRCDCVHAATADSVMSCMLPITTFGLLIFGLLASVCWCMLVMMIM